MPADAETTTLQRPLRIWPALVAVSLQWLLRFIIPYFVPEAILVGVFAGLGFGLVIIVWWLFFSRAPQAERWGAIALVIASMFLISKAVHPSIGGGMMGMMFYIFGIPTVSLGFVLWAFFSQRLAAASRWALLVVAMLLSAGIWTIIRTDGITGNATSALAWRWTPTAEEKSEKKD